MGDEDEHVWLDVSSDDGGRIYVAVCSCGWRSSKDSTAGLAGGAADQRVADMAAGS